MCAPVLHPDTHYHFICINKIINIYDSKLSSQLIQLNKNKSTREHPIKERKDHANRDIRRSYLMQRAATMWNSLTWAGLRAKTTITFKNRLDKFWENHLLSTLQTMTTLLINTTCSTENTTKEPEPGEEFQEELVILCDSLRLEKNPKVS